MISAFYLTSNKILTEINIKKMQFPKEVSTEKMFSF